MVEVLLFWIWHSPAMSGASNHQVPSNLWLKIAWVAAGSGADHEAGEFTDTRDLNPVEISENICIELGKAQRF